MYGDKLKNLRENSELTQKEIGKLLGITKEGYGQYEREYVIIPIKHLIFLSNYFKVSIDYLFNFSNNLIYDGISFDIDKEKMRKRLKEFRKGNNLTQLKLATYLKTTQSVIADYERGRYIIATPFLYTICNRYNMSADYLLGRVDSPKCFK